MRALSLLFSLALLPACTGSQTPAETNAADTNAAGAVVGVALTPFNPSLSVGETLQFEAKAFFDDGSHADYTSTVSWASSNERSATINAAGLVTANEAGTANIIATSDSGISAKVSLTVKDNGLLITSVSVSPEALSLRVSDTAQLSAIATYSDNSTGNITSQCSWSSANPSRVTVSEFGVISAIAAGDSAVDTDCSGQKASATITVEVADFVLPQPDLQLNGFTTTVGTMGTIRFEATVKNVGTGYASAFWVQGFSNLAASPRSTDVDDAYTWVPGLASGDSAVIDISSLGELPGSYQSWLAVDLLNEVSESNESNNIEGPLSLTVDSVIGRPDLTITEFVALGDSSGTLYQFTIKNTGAMRSSPAWADLWYSRSDDPVPGVDMLGDDFTLIPSLEVNETFSWQPDTLSGPTGPNDWRSCIAVDSMLEIDELIEDNNVKCQFVDVL